MSFLKNHFGPVVRDLLINSGINGRAVPRRIRGTLLRSTGHSIHESAVLCADTFLGSRNGLTVGEGSFINYGCFFDLGAETVIGDRTSIGYQAMFITCTHEQGDSNRRTGKPYTEPIVVGDGVWIGARATILPGVTIGTGCMVASGAVVTSDCEPNTLYAGVPAKKIRSLESPGESEASSSINGVGAAGVLHLDEDSVPLR